MVSQCGRNAYSNNAGVKFRRRLDKNSRGSGGEAERGTNVIEIRYARDHRPDANDGTGRRREEMQTVRGDSGPVAENR